MIIEIAGVKYQTASDRCFDKIKKHGLLEKVNSILEWDFCKFPVVWEKDPSGAKDENGKDLGEWKEKRDFLGDSPELKPGNVFKYGNQLLSFDDEDTLVLVLSETGAGGLQRIWNEIISQELSLAYNYDLPDSLTYKQVDPSEIPESWETYGVHYEIMKIFRDRFIPGREFPEKGLCLKIEMASDMYIFPVHFYLRDWDIIYNPEELEIDQMDYAVKQVLAWFYANTPRLSLPTPKKEQEEGENQ